MLVRKIRISKTNLHFSWEYASTGSGRISIGKVRDFERCRQEDRKILLLFYRKLEEDRLHKQDARRPNSKVFDFQKAAWPYVFVP